MKKIMMILMIIVLSISMVACSTNALENYKVAVDKTDNMVRGSESMKIMLESKYNLDGLDNDVQKMLQSFENISFSMKGSFDRELKKSMNMGYLKYGDFGYDFNIYGVDEELYLEPYFLNLKDHKFIKLTSDRLDIANNNMPVEILDKIGAKWNEIILEENVMRGENVLVTTDDGEVKSREFTITLNDKQLKEFITYIIELFEENEEYLDIMEKSAYISSEEELTEEEKEQIFRETFTQLKIFIMNNENLNLIYKAYIDVDNYVVQEDITFSMVNNSSNTGELESLKFTMNHNYWNIEKEQELNFQTSNEKDSINLEDLDINELIPQKEVK